MLNLHTRKQVRRQNLRRVRQAPTRCVGHALASAVRLHVPVVALAPAGGSVGREASKWSCDTCTFLNQPEAIACSVCTIPRAGVAPACTRCRLCCRLPRVPRLHLTRFVRDALRTSTICCFLTAAAGAGDRFARASGLPARPPNHQLPAGATLALRLAAQPSSPWLCIIEPRRSTDRVVRHCLQLQLQVAWR